ncbi:MAG: hypothetical protein CMB94_01710 [Flammeovirgaceae bacterium]|nr:hypothetical protein [Flammeovirgaceae bacterium]
MRRFLILILFNLIHFISGSQDLLFPINPGSQNYLSGNLGELRSDHFHMGLDIKTYGRINVPVYASDDGYIERVRVSGTGYGKALYLKHNNGFKSVYAHLNSFNKEIEKYVTDYQYRNEKFIVNLYPGKKFYFKKGEIIGYSGNSGSSGGPHLHYEIRDREENVMNPLNFSFKEIKDNIKPTIKSVSLKTLSFDSRINGMYGLLDIPIQGGNKINLNLEGDIGISVSAFDMLDGYLHKVGISRFQLFLDNKLLVDNKIDTLSYSETNFVTWFIDQDIFKKFRKQYVKLYQDDGNKLSFHKNSENGIINFNKQKSYKINIVVFDFFNNKSTVEINVNTNEIKKYNFIDLFDDNYYVLGNTLVIRSKIENREFIEVKFSNRLDISRSIFSDELYNYYIIDLRKDLPEKAFLQDKEIDFNFIEIENDKIYDLDNKNLKLEIANNNIFDTMYVEFEKKIDTIEKFIFKNSLPLKKVVSVTLKPKNTYNKEKSFIYDISNKPSFIGGVWEENNIVFKTSELSEYSILEDKEPPVIERVKFNNDLMVFRIYDELSGIKSYEGRINNNWILFEYDNKNDIIISKKKNSIQSFKGRFVLEVIDNTNNRRTLNLNL